MLHVILSILCAIFAYGLGYLLGCRHGRSTNAAWLVRPHTARTLAEVSAPDYVGPPVSQASFVRTNLPGSTSTFE